MRVYVAASFADIDRANLAAERLQDAGHQITSGWLEGGGSIDPARPDDWPKTAKAWAARCISDIQSSEAVLVLDPGRSTTGGLMWEFGYAMALGLPVVVVGLPSSVFCYLVPCVPYVEQAVDHLAGLALRLAADRARKERQAR